MEFLIYDHECPKNDRDYFADVVPWICVAMTIYVTVKFLMKLLDTAADNEIALIGKNLKDLEEENAELRRDNDKLKEELDQQFEVLKAITRSFVINEHPLTKVD